MWWSYLSSFLLPPSKTWCSWPYRSHTLALTSNHPSIFSPLFYIFISPFPFPFFLSSFFLFFILPRIPTFLLSCDPGGFTQVASRNTSEGSLRYRDCNTEENTTPSTTNSQQFLWKGWGLGSSLTHNGIWRAQSWAGVAQVLTAA